MLRTMNLLNRDFFEPLWSVRRFDNRFSEIVGGGLDESSSPRVNVWSNHERVVVAAEVPGIAPETIDVNVEGDTVRIRGEFPEISLEGMREDRRERGRGEFTRTFELPFAIDPDKVTAECRAGLLTVTLPRAATERPVKVHVR